MTGGQEIPDARCPDDDEEEVAFWLKREERMHVSMVHE